MVLPNPKPGAARSRWARAPRKTPISPIRSAYSGASCMVRGSPFMCMTHRPQRERATASMAPGCRKP
ncbi:Uncharacterised protein [Bordetella pertussis]|nr:Uncharacterised protein [Bordetella pertussis]